MARLLFVHGVDHCANGGGIVDQGRIPGCGESLSHQFVCGCQIARAQEAAAMGRTRLQRARRAENLQRAPPQIGKRPVLLCERARHGDVTLWRRAIFRLRLIPLLGKGRMGGDICRGFSRVGLRIVREVKNPATDTPRHPDRHDQDTARNGPRDRQRASTDVPDLTHSAHACDAPMPCAEFGSLHYELPASKPM